MQYTSNPMKPVYLGLCHYGFVQESKSTTYMRLHAEITGDTVNRNTQLGAGAHFIQVQY